MWQFMVVDMDRQSLQFSGVVLELQLKVKGLDRGWGTLIRVSLDLLWGP